MLRPALTLTLLLVCGPAVAAPIKVFILAGQSNAGGGMPPGAAPPPLNDPQENLYQFKVQTTQLNESADWEDLRPLVGNQGGWGTELSFAQAMERRTGAPVAIIKAAWGGTTLWREWLPGLPSGLQLYPWMMTKVNSSLDQLETLGYEPDISGFLWVQGEGDANQQDKSLAYDDNLATLAAALRNDLGVPDLPFVLNQAHIDLARSFVPELRASQQNAADLDPNMHLINMDDLAMGVDNVHWVPDSYLELGRRFADVLAPSGDFNDDGLVDGADLPVWNAAYHSNRTGDGNADGVADGSDFLLWQRQLGVTPPPQLPNVAVIPEPSTGLLLTVGLAALAAHALRRA